VYQGHRIKLFTPPTRGCPEMNSALSSKRAGRSLKWHHRGTARFPGASHGDLAVAEVVAVGPDRPGIYRPPRRNCWMARPRRAWFRMAAGLIGPVPGPGQGRDRAKSIREANSRRRPRVGGSEIPRSGRCLTGPAGKLPVASIRPDAGRRRILMADRLLRLRRSARRAAPARGA
jgi:hypothetical protein